MCGLKKKEGNLVFHDSLSTLQDAPEVYRLKMLTTASEACPHSVLICRYQVSISVFITVEKNNQVVFGCNSNLFSIQISIPFVCVEI